MTHTQTINSPVLTVSEAMSYLRMGRTSFYAEIKAGRLPYRKFGRKTFVFKADADAYLERLPTGLCSPIGKQSTNE